MTPADTDQKLFRPLQAAAALGGYALMRSDPADGPVRLFLERFGLVQEVTVPELVERFLSPTGGRVVTSQCVPHIAPIGDTLSHGEAHEPSHR